jgi:hypothetical protein
MEHVIGLGLGLIIGIPLTLLVYWKTKRDQKLGLGSGYVGGDFTSSGGQSGGGDGSDSSS